jgi:epoxyqueuosine reductase
VKRAKRRGLLRNVAVALGNAGDASKRPILERMAEDTDPVVREHAAWALRRLDARLSSAEGSS